ncbi:CFEM domain-containing protein [Colletotrichum asianum]
MELRFQTLCIWFLCGVALAQNATEPPAPLPVNGSKPTNGSSTTNGTSPVFAPCALYNRGFFADVISWTAYLERSSCHPARLLTTQHASATTKGSTSRWRNASWRDALHEKESVSRTTSLFLSKRHCLVLMRCITATQKAKAEYCHDPVRSQVKMLYGLRSIEIAAWFLVLFRFYARWATRLRYGWDDYVMMGVAASISFRIDSRRLRTNMW